MVQIGERKHSYSALRPFSSEEETMRGSIYLSCVDSVKARFNIGEVLTHLERAHHYHNNPKYWLDFGNSTHSGQVILGTLQAIEQPHSDTFTPIDTLPTITQAFGELLTQSEQNDNTPSCSLAEALTKQDLFIKRHPFTDGKYPTLELVQRRTHSLQRLFPQPQRFSYTTLSCINNNTDKHFL